MRNVCSFPKSKEEKRKCRRLLQIPVLLLLYGLSYLTNRLYNSRKKIKAVYAVRKEYFLGLLPTKSYSGY